MVPNRSILAFDCNGLGWGIFHAMPGLTHSDMGTAVIYGFLKTVLAIQADICADTIVFAWDSKESKRREIYPGYKLDRTKKRQEATPKEKAEYKEMLRQFRELRVSILPSLGFSNSFALKGFEGDDILAKVAVDNPKSRVTIVSRDNDMYQLITRNCVIYDFKENVYWNESKFFKEYDIAPERWLEVKSMAGCSGDAVPGLPRIGPPTAIKYLKKQLKPSSKAYQTIYNGAATIEFTKRLVELPHEGTPSFKLQNDTCTVAAWKEVCKQYGLKSLLAHGRIMEFESCFCY